MSQSHVVDVSLEQLLERSTHIVIARQGMPVYDTEVVAVEAEGKQYPPYRRLVYRYHVLESLRGDLKKDNAIEVISANDGTNEEMHRLYVTKNISKSAYDPRYQPQAAFAPREPRILFLRQQATGNCYSEVAGDSAEGMAMRSEIERRLKKKSP